MRTVGELLEYLQQLVERDESVEDMPLRLAIQPAWPLALTVDNVRVFDGKLWIAAGGHPHGESPYSDIEVWDQEF